MRPLARGTQVFGGALPCTRVITTSQMALQYRQAALAVRMFFLFPFIQISDLAEEKWEAGEDAKVKGVSKY